MWDAKKKAKLQATNTWTFIMISPEQNLAVVNWLTSKSKRPLKSVKLWALLFDNVHRETGQIMLSRQELSEKIEEKLYNISRIMTELESIRAILKKKDGRSVIYYMNPNVANHYPQKIREKAQQLTPKLKILDGGKECDFSSIY